MNHSIIFTPFEYKVIMERKNLNPFGKSIVSQGPPTKLLGEVTRELIFFDVIRLDFRFR